MCYLYIQLVWYPSHVTHSEVPIGRLLNYKCNMKRNWTHNDFNGNSLEDIFFSRVYRLSTSFPGTLPTPIRFNLFSFLTALDLPYVFFIELRLQSSSPFTDPEQSVLPTPYGLWGVHTPSLIRKTSGCFSSLSLQQAETNSQHGCWGFFFLRLRHFSVEAMNRDGSWFNKIKSCQIMHVWELWFQSTRNSTYW